MSLVGFKARNHPQQTELAVNAPRRSFVDDRETPPQLFDVLHARFRFTVDVAASDDNAKLPRFYTVEDDGLEQGWIGERVWCNPPYSAIRPWVEKAWGEHHAGCELIVMVLPANRTEQAWWQDLVEPRRDRPSGGLRVEFLRGRLRFIGPGAGSVRPNERPPFGCCLLIWEGAPIPRHARGEASERRERSDAC